MDPEPGQVNSEASEKDSDVFKFVASRMKGGTDKQKISLELAQTGIDEKEAARLVDTAYREVVKVVLKERVTGGAFQSGIFGGLLAAIAGGIAWAAVIILSGFELGIAAWGLGFLSGYAVVRFAGGRKGVQLQGVAVVSAVLAVLVGKYITFVYYFTDEMAEGWNLGVFFSPDTVEMFFGFVLEMSGGFDLFWIFLAVMSAWKIPRGLGIDLPPQYSPPYVIE